MFPAENIEVDHFGNLLHQAPLRISNVLLVNGNLSVCSHFLSKIVTNSLVINHCAFFCFCTLILQFQRRETETLCNVIACYMTSFVNASDVISAEKRNVC